MKFTIIDIKWGIEIKDGVMISYPREIYGQSMDEDYKKISEFSHLFDTKYIKNEDVYRTEHKVFSDFYEWYLDQEGYVLVWDESIYDNLMFYFSKHNGEINEKPFLIFSEIINKMLHDFDTKELDIKKALEMAGLKSEGIAIDQAKSYVIYEKKLLKKIIKIGEEVTGGSFLSTLKVRNFVIFLSYTFFGFKDGKMENARLRAKKLLREHGLKGYMSIDCLYVKGKYADYTYKHKETDIIRYTKRYGYQSEMLLNCDISEGEILVNRMPKVIEAIVENEERLSIGVGCRKLTDAITKISKAAQLLENRKDDINEIGRQFEIRNIKKSAERGLVAV